MFRVLLLVGLVALAASDDGHFLFRRTKSFDAVPADLLAVLDNASDAGEPVHISPDMASLSEQEKQVIREKSRVSLPGMDYHNGASSGANPFAYSGYISVDPTHNSNMFYWFFESIDGNKNAPVLLWLQGGPGGTSMFGLFSENGPYYLTQNLQLMPRNITWNQNYAMIFIDNPVGVGFSYTDATGYSTTEEEVAQNLYTALSTFFGIYTSYAANDFYITGESYAGKYIPATAYKIINMNRANAAAPINLVGVAIGDGFTDPREMVQGYGSMGFSFGLYDEAQLEEFAQIQHQIVQDIDAQKWIAAANGFFALVDGPPDLFSNFTGSSNYYDIRLSVEPSYGGNIDAYLNQSTIRQSLHVGNHYFDVTSGIAGAALTPDIAVSQKFTLPTLLDSIKVLFYNGQFDYIVGPELCELMLPTIPWNGISNFLMAPKTIWKVSPSDVEVAGYVKNYKSLTQIVVRGAGHILPFDQPARAFDMITRFVNDLPWTN